MLGNEDRDRDQNPEEKKPDDGFPENEIGPKRNRADFFSLSLLGEGPAVTMFLDEINMKCQQRQEEQRKNTDVEGEKPGQRISGHIISATARDAACP